VATAPADARPGWTLPALAGGRGWAAVPFLYVTSTSFVISLALGSVAVVLSLVLLPDPAVPPSRKAVAVLGLLGTATATALAVIPFVGQG
jgi:hypothetical protein